MRYIMLGSGAVRDNPNRGGPSQLLQIGNENWMFDCGRSACTNLARAGVNCENVDRLFLTHLHFDHIVDVPYLVFVGWVKVRKKPLQIYGPVGTKHFVSHVIRPPFEQDIQSRIGHGKDDSVLDPEVIEIGGKRRISIHGRLSIIRNIHGSRRYPHTRLPRRYKRSPRRNYRRRKSRCGISSILSKCRSVVHRMFGHG